jgi:hypothetical protein
MFKNGYEPKERLSVASFEKRDNKIIVTIDLQEVTTQNLERLPLTDKQNYTWLYTKQTFEGHFFTVQAITSKKYLEELKNKEEWNRVFMESRLAKEKAENLEKELKELREFKEKMQKNK